jgi:hypothetical protein
MMPLFVGTHFRTHLRACYGLIEFNFQTTEPLVFTEPRAFLFLEIRQYAH